MNSVKTKQLTKILIGAAWIDGEVKEKELVFLRKFAAIANVLDDSEIQHLLTSNDPITSEVCLSWLKAYLGEKPSKDSYHELLESLKSLIQADGEVEAEEAELIKSLEELNPTSETSNSFADKFFRILGKFTKSTAGYCQTPYSSS